MDPHLTCETAAACLQAVHLDTEQLFFERRRGSLAGTCAEEAQSIAGHLQQFLGKCQVPLRCQEFSTLHPHLSPQPTRPLRYLGTFYLQFTHGHSNAPGYTAIE